MLFRHKSLIRFGAAKRQRSNSIVSVAIRRTGAARRVRHHETVITPLEERTVALQYVTDPRRSIERKAWLQRQHPNNRSAHVYGRLFVNEARELYFAKFARQGNVSMICWLVNKHKQCLCITEDAYHEALKKPLLGGHQFYQRCDGAWLVKNLRLDPQSSGRRPE